MSERYRVPGPSLTDRFVASSTAWAIPRPCRFSRARAKRMWKTAGRLTRSDTVVISALVSVIDISTVDIYFAQVWVLNGEMARERLRGLSAPLDTLAVYLLRSERLGRCHVGRMSRGYPTRSQRHSYQGQRDHRKREGVRPAHFEEEASFRKRRTTTAGPGSGTGSSSFWPRCHWLT